jgi:hypothetical protein
MRGTIHLTPAQDVGWLRDLTSAKALGAPAERRRSNLGLTLGRVETVREAVIETLTGGAALPRDVLLEAVSARGVRIEDHWRYHLIWFLAQTGTLVLGPIQDGRPSLVLANEWIANPRRLERDEALAELAARYVNSHGPAQADDLAWWSGLGKRDVAKALNLAGDRVTQLNGEDGGTYWVSPALAGSQAISGVALLPAFDELLLGYRDRSLTLDRAQASAVCPGGNGVFKPVVVANGICVGTWRAPARGALKKLAIDQPVPVAVTWFNKESSRLAARPLVAAAANRYARYLGRRRAAVTTVTA